MIIVNVKGGTGNQLFQYALGRHLALKNHDTLLLDSDGLARANETGDIYRPLALDAFNIEKKFATPEQIKKYKYPFGFISKAWRYIRLHLLKKTNVAFDEKVLAYQGNMYLDGYWQSPKYFDAIRDVLLKEFTLKNPLSAAAAVFAEQIQQSTAVSLHVRRGDYVKNPRVLKEFGVCSIQYYEAAISHIEKQVSNPTFFVFSDDIAWVQEHLPVGSQAIFVHGDNIKDYEELTLMSMCKHNIIANSSFSWWGAWLNNHPNKIVIAPTPWFETTEYDIALIPPTWTQLPK